MSDKRFGKKGWTPELMKAQKGKTFVITGTTSGTGFEAARILLSKGAKVVMLNRNPQKSADVIASLKLDLGNKKDKAVAEKLWKWSEKETGMKWNF
jgi:NAD(P)-dependent dehydrogenase (short-subunit alcohol dehydrogenase family)